MNLNLGFLKNTQTNWKYILSSRTPSFPRKGGANSNSPQSSVERLDQIGTKQETTQPFCKKGCPKGDSARAPHQSKLGAGQAPRVPIWIVAVLSFIAGANLFIYQKKQLIPSPVPISFYRPPNYQKMMGQMFPEKAIF